jgi:hypothetical protein
MVTNARRMAGRPALVSGGWRLAAGASLELRPWRVPALILGGVLACIASLALAALPGATAPRTPSLASRHALLSDSVRMPISLAPAASGSIGVSDRSFWPVRQGASFLTQGGRIHGIFNASGAALRVGKATVALSLAGVGRGRSLDPVAAVAPTRAANQILYRHGSIGEFYRNGPYGLEQGFTVPKRAWAGSGSLVVALGISGSLVPEQVGSQILLRTKSGATALRYGQLSAVDAAGRRLPAQMQIRNGTLELLIDDSNARYPLRIDPFVQQGAKLVGTGAVGGVAVGAGQGTSVALSGDGNTALVGGNAVWVFTRSGTTWTQQGPKLVGTGAGWSAQSVALSSDGNTALVGGGGTGGVGAVWVFTRSGTTWTQQGPKLVGTGAVGGLVFQGSSVALSSDGNTALVGGYLDDNNAGAVWVFTRSGTTWTQQGPKLVGTGAVGGAPGALPGAGQGISVALSGDGNTALVGGFRDNGDAGAVWVFTRSGTTWTQQGPKLVGTGAVGDAEQGSSVALSDDGNTALVGGLFDNGRAGAVWVFTRSGTTWTQQGPKLVGTGAVGDAEQGISVALSSDGNTALVGGPGVYGSGAGAVWVFTRSGTTWTQQGPKLVGTGAVGDAFQGSSVALSSEGNTALVGGPGDNPPHPGYTPGAGAVWVFVTQQAVTQLPPPLAGALTLPGAVNGSGHQTVSLTNANGYSVIASLQETVKLTGGAVIATATNDPRTTTITIASASKTIAAHKTVKLKLKLSTRALKLLRKYRRMKVTLRLTLSARGRPSRIVKKTIVLHA